MALSVLLLCLVQLQLGARADGDARFRPPIFTLTDKGRAQCWPPNSYYAQTVSLSLPRGETRPEDDVLPVFLFRLRSNSDADRPGEVVGFILGALGSQPILGVTFTNEHDGLHVRACPQPADGPSSCRTKSRSSDGVPIEVRFPFVQVTVIPLPPNRLAGARPESHIYVLRPPSKWRPGPTARARFEFWAAL